MSASVGSVGFARRLWFETLCTVTLGAAAAVDPCGDVFTNSLGTLLPS